MLTKEDINFYKLANSALKSVTKIMRPYIKKPITTAVEVMEYLHLENVSEAKIIAKKIGVKLIKDKSLGMKLRLLKDEALEAHNLFIVLHETTAGSYLKVIWSGN